MARRVIHPAADFDYWAHIGANAPQFEDDYDMMDEDEEEYERKPIVNHRFSPGRLVAHDVRGPSEGAKGRGGWE